jgi:hypothetical protein
MRRTRGRALQPVGQVGHDQPAARSAQPTQAFGAFTGGDPKRVAPHLWAVAHGMVNLELNGQLPGLAPAEDLFLEALGYAGAPFLGIAP